MKDRMAYFNISVVVISKENRLSGKELNNIQNICKKYSKRYPPSHCQKILHDKILLNFIKTLSYKICHKKGWICHKTSCKVLLKVGKIKFPKNEKIAFSPTRIL